MLSFAILFVSSRADVKLAPFITALPNSRIERNACQYRPRRRAFHHVWGPSLQYPPVIMHELHCWATAHVSFFPTFPARLMFRPPPRLPLLHVGQYFVGSAGSSSKNTHPTGPCMWAQSVNSRGATVPARTCMPFCQHSTKTTLAHNSMYLPKCCWSLQIFFCT